MDKFNLKYGKTGSNVPKLLKEMDFTAKNY